MKQSVSELLSPCTFQRDGASQSVNQSHNQPPTHLGTSGRPAAPAPWLALAAAGTGCAATGSQRSRTCRTCNNNNNDTTTATLQAKSINRAAVHNHDDDDGGNDAEDDDNGDADDDAHSCCLVGRVVLAHADVRAVGRDGLRVENGGL